MPTGHQTCGFLTSAENETVCDSPAARWMVRCKEVPATTPLIVVSCGEESRFRASTFTVNAARAKSGSDSFEVTRGKRTCTGPVCTFLFLCFGLLLLFGGVGFFL